MGEKCSVHRSVCNSASVANGDVDLARLPAYTDFNQLIAGERVQEKAPLAGLSWG